jgi:redox-sensing transcriptional repressor
MGRVAGEAAQPENRPSRAGAARLSLYLRRLDEFARSGAATVSSGQLAAALGVGDAQVRRDLGCLGAPGHPGVGYRTHELIAAIRRTLGLDREWSVVLVGVGNLARALVRYQGFRQQGFRVRALFDSDPAKMGLVVEGLPVQPLEELSATVAAVRAELGVLTVPSESAQAVANLLCTAGVRGILNFAPVVLRLPERVRVVTVDLTVQLEQLAFLVQVGGD